MMRLYPRLKLNKSGFTLAELLLGAAIMAFALVGLLALFISCMRFDEFNRNLSQATGHTQFVMEEIKNELANSNLQNIKDKIDEGDWNWSQEGGQIADNGLNPVSEEVIVTTYDEDDTDPLDVTVSVTWRDNPVGLELKTSFTESGSGGAEEDEGDDDGGDDEDQEDEGEEDEDDEDEEHGRGH